MLDLVSCSKHWPHLFPQHGAGLKHRRKASEEDLFLSALLLLQSLARHPGDLLRRLRSAGRRLAPGRAMERLGRPPRGGRDPGPPRRPEAL